MYGRNGGYFGAHVGPPPFYEDPLKDPLHPWKYIIDPDIILHDVDDDDKHLDPSADPGRHYRMNVTGNIYYSTTNAQIKDSTKDLFNTATVLFAAITKAMSDAGKSILDYNALVELIRKCGYFSEITKAVKSITFTPMPNTVNTQLIVSLIPGIPDGSKAMETCKDVLNSLGEEVKDQADNVKVAHMLFVCEEIDDKAVVTVKLYYATKETHHQLLSSPCSKNTSAQFIQVQEANCFLFGVPSEDPQYDCVNTQYNCYTDKMKKFV